jgi:hypothetical protein
VSQPEIRAIETRYRGYRFRSRLEARWAVFFDALGIPWVYEPEGYEYAYDGKTYRYLPDFYLPNISLRSTGESGGLFVKVKPTVERSDDDKLFGFVEHVRKSLLLLIGEVGVGCNHRRGDGHFEFAYYPPNPETNTEGGCSWDNMMHFMKCYQCGRIKVEFLESNYMHCDACGHSQCDDDHPDLARAVAAARSARFEFGESGAA